MKLALISTFVVFWLNNIVVVDSNACTDLSYQPDADKIIEDKFKSEYSFINGVKNKFWCLTGPKAKEISIKDPTVARQLCACALEKLSNRKANTILKNMIYGTTRIPVYIWPYYLLVPFYAHYFPAIWCMSTVGNMDSCLLAKGPQKQSEKKQVFNIYVAKQTGEYDDDPIYDFLGVIENVDLEDLTNEIEETKTPGS